MHGLDAHVAYRKSVRSMICDGFLTTSTTVFLHRLNTTILQSAKARIISQNGLKWPYIQLCYHLLTSL